MTDIKPKKTSTLFSASKQFWLCNFSGWLIYVILQSLRDAFDGSSIVDNLIQHVPTLALGMLAGLGVHFFYHKRNWYTQHPLRLIPKSVFISILFAAVNVFVNFFNLAILLPEICASNYLHTPNHCGQLSDFFIQSMEAMLCWCLLYFSVESERIIQAKHPVKFTDLFKALIAWVFFMHIGTVLSTIAYIEIDGKHYLFSSRYFLSSVTTIILTPLLASYIFFIKPGNQLFGSRILPLVPTLCVMSFCCAVVNIGVERAVSLSYDLYSQDHLFSTRIYLLFFGLDYGGFSNKGQLAGTLQGEFTGNFITALFLLSYWHTRWGASEWHPPISAKKSFSFWFQNFLFWFFLGLAIYATDAMDLSSSGKSIPTVSIIAFSGVGVFVGGVLRSQIHYFATQKTQPWVLNLKIFIASSSMGLLLTSSIWLINYVYIFVFLNGENIKEYITLMHLENYVFASVLASCLVCGLWSFVCYMLESQHLQRDATIKQLQIEMNMKEAQLNALAGKVDPHFVFNALNNIRALVDEDSEKARSAIVVLSDILRSPITHNLQSKVTLAEEMQLVRNYIALSKIQFEDNLVYQEDIGEDTLCALIPSMMLQILVENAIKHGISQLPDGGVLSLEVRRSERRLRCKITNDGNLTINSSTSGFGVGTKVVTERLALLYDNNANFRLQEINNTVVAELSFPFETTV